MNLYQEHTICRACGSKNLVPVFNLGDQPLANALHKPEAPPAPCAPLAVLYCEACTLAQLSVTVDPRVLYGYYTYSTPESATQREHMRVLADTLMMSHPKTVVEIGSNNGMFLEELRDRDCKVWGVDPSPDQAGKARQRGINTIVANFEDVAGQFDKTDLIVARHVFCHVDNWRRFVHGLEKMSHKASIVAIEVPSVRDLLSGCFWDTIYHEHTSYLTLRALQALLVGTSLQIDRVFHYAIHGGSTVILLRHRDHGAPSAYCVESSEKRVSKEEWDDFSTRAGRNRMRLIRQVTEHSLRGIRYCGYGAPAKATVMLNACRFDQSRIQFVTDTTTEKVGCVIPGTDIPVVDEGELASRQPPYALLFAWNYEAEIRAKETAYTGQFINPHRI